MANGSPVDNIPESQRQRYNIDESTGTEEQTEDPPSADTDPLGGPDNASPTPEGTPPNPENGPVPSPETTQQTAEQRMDEVEAAQDRVVGPVDGDGVDPDTGTSTQTQVDQTDVPQDTTQPETTTDTQDTTTTTTDTTDTQETTTPDTSDVQSQSKTHPSGTEQTQDGRQTESTERLDVSSPQAVTNQDRLQEIDTTTPKAFTDESVLQQDYSIEAESEAEFNRKLRQETAERFTQATVGGLSFGAEDIQLQETDSGVRPVLASEAQSEIQSFREQRFEQSLREEAATAYTEATDESLEFSREDITLQETEEGGYRPVLASEAQEQIQLFREEGFESNLRSAAAERFDADPTDVIISEGEDGYGISLTREERTERIETQATEDLQRNLSPGVFGVTRAEAQQFSESRGASVRQEFEEQTVQEEDVTVGFEDGQPTIALDPETEQAIQEGQQRQIRDQLSAELGTALAPPDVSFEEGVSLTESGRRSVQAAQLDEQIEGVDVSESDLTIEEGPAPGPGDVQESDVGTLTLNQETQLELAREQNFGSLQEQTQTEIERSDIILESGQVTLAESVRNEELAERFQGQGVTVRGETVDTSGFDRGEDFRIVTEDGERTVELTPEGREIATRTALAKQGEIEVDQEGSEVFGFTIQEEGTRDVAINDVSELEFDDEGNLVGIGDQEAQRNYEALRADEGDVLPGVISEPLEGVGETSLRTVDAVGDVSGDLSQDFTQNVAIPAGDAVEDFAQDLPGGITLGGEKLAPQVAGGLTEGGLRLGSIALGSGQLVETAVDTTGSSAAFAAQNDIGESIDATLGTTESFARSTAATAARNPYVTVGSLVGSAGVMGAASKIGPRAGAATRYAIQPGEELLGTVGFRGTRAVAGQRTAQRLFPNQEPIIFSEEAAIRGGVAAANLGKRGLSTVSSRIDIPNPRSRLPNVDAELTTSQETGRVDVNVNRDVQIGPRPATEIEQDLERTARDAPSPSEIVTDVSFTARQGVGEVANRIRNFRESITRDPAEVEQTMARTARDAPSPGDVLTDIRFEAEQAPGRVRDVASEGVESARQTASETARDIQRTLRDRPQASDVATDVRFELEQAGLRAQEQVQPFLESETTRGPALADITPDVSSPVDTGSLRGRLQGRQLQLDAARTRAGQVAVEAQESARRLRREFTPGETVGNLATDVRFEGEQASRGIGASLREFASDTRTRSDTTPSDLLPEGSGRFESLRNLGVRIDIGKPSSRTVDLSRFDTDAGVEFEGELGSETEGDVGDTQPVVVEQEVEQGDQVQIMQQDARTQSETDAETETGVGQEFDLRGRRRFEATIDTGETSVTPQATAQGPQLSPEVEQLTTPDTSLDPFTAERARLDSGLGTEPISEATVETGTEQLPIERVSPGLESGTETEIDTETEFESGLRYEPRGETEQEFEQELELEGESRLETELFDFGETDQQSAPGGGPGTAQREIFTQFRDPLSTDSERETDGSDGLNWMG